MSRNNKTSKVRRTKEQRKHDNQDRLQYEIMAELFVGKTVVEITGVTQGSRLVVFHLDDGVRIRMVPEDGDSSWYGADVGLEEVIGDLGDLLGTITRAEVVSDKGDNQTWTFYHVATSKGLVTFRWFGESNGYYSEEIKVELDQVSVREVVLYNNGLLVSDKERDDALRQYRVTGSLPDECYYFQQQNILLPRDIDWTKDYVGY